MKRLIKYIQENLPIITLVPIVIGGFIQVLILGSIGLGYIRFFSASQVLIDGILILAILIMGFIGSMIPKLYFDGKFEGVFSSHDLVKKKQKEIFGILREDFIVNIISIVLIIFSFWILYNLYSSFHVSNQDQIFKILGIALIVSFGVELIASSTGVLLDRKMFFYKHISDKSSTKSILRVFLYSILIFILISKIFNSIIEGSKTEQYMLKGFSFPSNLTNISNLSINESDEIIYFNDKFIFLRNKNSQDITVKEFNKLFIKAE